jgi:hypothetical protein
MPNSFNAGSDIASPAVFFDGREAILAAVDELCDATVVARVATLIPYNRAPCP